MKRHHRIVAGSIVTALAMLVPLAMQVDRWLIERRAMINRLQYETEVAECEAGGGEWWRGECRRPSR